MEVAIRYFHLEGQYKGEHPIYESREEFAKDYPDEKVFLWGRVNENEAINKLEAGDWIEADDGYIVQCLNMRVWKGKSPRFIVRVPMGTFYIATSVNSKQKYQRLYAQFAQQDLYSISHKKPAYRDSTISTQLIQFAEYINAGLTPYEAFKKAGGITKCSPNSIQMKLISWLTDERVTEMTKGTESEFMNKIQNDEELTDDAMIQYVKDFMVSVRKGSQTHLNSIGPLLQLLGKTPPEMNANTKKKISQAEEVPYNAPPPEQIT